LNIKRKFSFYLKSNCRNRELQNKSLIYKNNFHNWKNLSAYKHKLKWRVIYKAGVRVWVDGFSLQPVAYTQTPTPSHIFNFGTFSFRHFSFRRYPGDSTFTMANFIAEQLSIWQRMLILWKVKRYYQEEKNCSVCPRKNLFTNRSKVPKGFPSYFSFLLRRLERYLWFLSNYIKWLFISTDSYSNVRDTTRISIMRTSEKWWCSKGFFE